MASLGSKIREIRLQRGMTQADLSSDLVTPSMISQIESDRARPSYPLITAIANRLGMPIEYFLNDLEDQFALTAHLRLAEYWLALGAVSKAKDILSQLSTTINQGLGHQEFRLLLAKVHRQQEEYAKATVLLEELREYALRTMDRRLEFWVCKETGYVEYATKNSSGAIHEWRKAIRIGEALAASEEQSTVQIQYELSELYVSLYDLLMERKEGDKAAAYLNLGSEYRYKFQSLRHIAQALVLDGIEALHAEDASRAKNTFDRAVSLIEAARMVERSILLDAKLGVDRAPEASWDQSAAATVSVDAVAFVESELVDLEKWLQHAERTFVRDPLSGNEVLPEDMTVSDQAEFVGADGRFPAEWAPRFATAQRRLERCFGILADYEQDVPDSRKKADLLRGRILQCQALIAYLHDQKEEAILLLREAVGKFEFTGGSNILGRALGKLLIWLTCMDKLDEALEVSELLHHYMNTTNRRGIA